MTEDQKAYTEDQLIMTLERGNGATHIDDIYYLNAWLKDDTIYYYDTTKSTWFKSDHKVSNDEEDEVIQTFDAIKNQNFLNNANIYIVQVNNIDYNAIEYIDESGAYSIYYFDDNMKLVAASSQENSGYIFITISLDEVTIPEEVLGADIGDYESYMLDLYTNIYMSNN